MSKELITPLSALKNLNSNFDSALIQLDEASTHFEHSVLNVDALTGDEFDKYTQEQKDEILKLLENYSLMSGFLLDHPLLSVIMQIRNEAKLSETNTNVMAIKHTLAVGQKFKHYKGTVYEIVSLAQNSNIPTITNVHYTSGNGKVWELPIHEFCKKITIMEKSIDRFALVK